MYNLDIDVVNECEPIRIDPKQVCYIYTMRLLDELTEGNSVEESNMLIYWDTLSNTVKTATLTVNSKEKLTKQLDAYIKNTYFTKSKSNNFTAAGAEMITTSYSWWRVTNKVDDDEKIQPYLERGRYGIGSSKYYVTLPWSIKMTDIICIGKEKGQKLPILCFNKDDDLYCLPISLSDYDALSALIPDIMNKFYPESRLGYWTKGHYWSKRKEPTELEDKYKLGIDWVEVAPLEWVTD